MLSISLDFNKKISSFNKTILMRIDGIVERYRQSLYSTLEQFRPRMEEIAIEETAKAGKVATRQLVDSYDAILNQVAFDMTLKLINDAHDPDWDVYYWQVINDGRKPGEKAPPTNEILKWLKAKGIQRQRRGKSGRFISTGGSLSGEKQQAFAIAKSIGVKGIKARPEIFTQMRNRIYIELRQMLTARLGVING